MIADDEIDEDRVVCKHITAAAGATLYLLFCPFAAWRGVQIKPILALQPLHPTRASMSLPLTCPGIVMETWRNVLSLPLCTCLSKKPSTDSLQVY